MCRQNLKVKSENRMAYILLAKTQLHGHTSLQGKLRGVVQLYLSQISNY